MRAQQLSAINAARSGAGKSTLAEDAQLKQIASEVADLYASYREGAITQANYQSQLNALMEKYNEKIKINGKTIAITIVTKVQPNNFTGWNYTASDVEVSTEAAYIGNAAVKVSSGYCCVAVLGEPLKEVIWTAQVNSDGTVTITGYHEDGAVPSGDITFPSYISGRKVTGIARGLGKLCNKITSVTIPGTIETLNEASFESCTSLKKVTIEDGMKYLEASVFKNCPALETVVMPDSIVGCYYDAFYGCASLKNVKLSSNLAYISGGMFKNCTSLEKISLPESSSIIYRNGAFENCTSLQKIYLPKNLTTIQYDAFKGCKNLTDVYYGGSQSDWLKVSIASGNEYLINENVTVHYNSLGF